MNAEKRFEEILSRLEKDRVVYTTVLVKDLKTSEATIRRDLQKLEELGKLKRISGGAVFTKKTNILTPSDEIYMNHRMNINWDSKKGVAQMACKEIQDGECVFLDGGSSIVPMIDELKNRKIKIITNNHLIISRLGENIKAEIIIIGGEYMNLYSMSVGNQAILQVNEYNYDRCFISCTGFDIGRNMVYLAETMTKGVKEAAIANSTDSYLLVDRSKQGALGFCKFTELSRFKTVFVDSLEDPEEAPANFRLM